MHDEAGDVTSMMDVHDGFWMCGEPELFIISVNLIPVDHPSSWHLLSRGDSFIHLL